MTMTDTPETDGEWNRLACQDHPEFERNIADFARKLERERDEMQERMIDAERQRDKLAALLQRNRDGYGGQMVDPECGCCDCKWLQPIDEALAAWKEARSESALP